MSDKLDWNVEGRDWPNRDASRFVAAGGLRWHVQVMGQGPVALLLHGTGASTHSFRDLAPLLARRFTVVAPDLPGHGFTATPETSAGFTLPQVAAGVAALLATLGMRPIIAVGHSAGAAIAIRMALDGLIEPAAIVSVNGALLPYPIPSTGIVGAAARVVATSGLTARAFAFLAGAGQTVDRMLRATGSTIDMNGVRYYGRLASNPGHVA